MYFLRKLDDSHICIQLLILTCTILLSFLSLSQTVYAKQLHEKQFRSTERKPLKLIDEDPYEPDGAVISATVITSGEVQTHSISTADDQDWLMFTLTTTSTVVIETNGTEGDTVLTLYDADINEVAFNDDWNSSFSYITVCEESALPPGTYYVLVHSYAFSEVVPDYQVTLATGGECEPTSEIVDFISSTVDVLEEDAYEPDSEVISATVITDGEVQTHSISTVDDQDWLTFTLSDTVGVLITSDGLSGDIVLELYDVDLSLVAINDNIGASLTLDMTCENFGTLPAGTYHILAYAYSLSEVVPDYQISVATTEACTTIPDELVVNEPYEPNGVFTAATPITHGEVQTHTILTDGDEDWLTFTLVETSTAAIATTGSRGDTVLTLYDGDLNEVATNDDWDGSSFSYIEACGKNALPAGTYYIQARAFGLSGIVPDYQVSLLLNGDNCAEAVTQPDPILIELAPDLYEPNDIITTATLIVNGEVQTHTISTIEDEDWLMFTLVETSTAEIVTTGSSGDTVLTLYDGDLNEIATNDDWNSAFSYIGVCEDASLSAGTYYVQLHAFGFNGLVPDYQVSLVLDGDNCINTVTQSDSADDRVEIIEPDQYEPNDVITNPTTITDGEVQTHTISTIEDEDWLTFTLVETSTVVIATAGSRGDTVLTLYDGTLNRLAYSDNWIDSFSYIGVCEGNMLPAGTYYIHVHAYDFSDEVPDYRVRVDSNDAECVNTASFVAGGTEIDSEIEVVSEYAQDRYEPNGNAPNATLITAGETQQHTLDSRVDEDWLMFVLAEPSGVEIVTNGTSGDTFMELYDASLNLLATDDDGNGFFAAIALCGDATLPTGNYYVQIRAFGYAEAIPTYQATFNVNDPRCLGAEATAISVAQLYGRSNGTLFVCIAAVVLTLFLLSLVVIWRGGLLMGISQRNKR